MVTFFVCPEYFAPDYEYSNGRLDPTTLVR